MKKYLLSLLVLGLPFLGLAQIDTVSIRDVQFRSQDSLQACIETSPYLGDTVVVYGTVVVDGGLAYSADGRQVWIQDGPGGWNGIDVRYGGGGPTTPTDMWDLVVGDSVRITGIVERFGAETQLNPLSNGVEVIDGGRPVVATRVDLGDLNDNQQVDQLETGEQWEGQYIELVNLTVDRQGDVFSNGSNRQNFICRDEDGNLIQISDRFPAGRSVNSVGNNNQNDDDGELIIPPAGAKIDTIRGLIFHTAPAAPCLNPGNFPAGYDLHPFDLDDIVIGASGPLISDVARNPLVPASTEATNISANIVDPDGDVVSAFVNYAVGLNSTNFLQVALVANPGTNTYTAQIPETAYSNGDYIRYYITATDDSAVTTTFPSGGQNDAILYRVRDGGATIVDVQFNPVGGNSLLQGADVTVTGVVTAAAQAGDLGYVFIQQPGEDQWAGIQLVGGSIADLERGDSIRVQGSVEENFGFTRLSVITVDDLGTGAMMPEPIVVNADSFASYTRYAESYESMLVTFENPEAGKGMYVVNNNPDAPSNFAEWTLGNSTLSDQGSRVLVGRQTGSSFSSLNFSYVNDSSWVTESGAITVPVCVVSVLDTMESLSGIMAYTFGNFKLLPRNNEDVAGYSGANCPDGITSIEAPVETGLKVYPNPVRETLTIEYAADLAESLNVQLMDMTGRVVREIRTQPGRDLATMNVSDLTAGLYLIRVAGQNETLMTQKVLVK